MKTEIFLLPLKHVVGFKRHLSVCQLTIGISLRPQKAYNIYAICPPHPRLAPPKRQKLTYLCKRSLVGRWLLKVLQHKAVMRRHLQVDFSLNHKFK